MAWDGNPLTSCLCTGTKWCGAGDLADNYFDLGVEAMLDKCCRTHDLCPVKVRAYTSRYNLTNNSLYTKSHCTCDAILLQCLKDAQHSTADIMGNIYFNLLKVPCVRQGKDRTTFQPAERYDNPIIRG
ncbi:group 3 secretory phospholipase A2-like [Homalodisca vitripennis]|uniref:group 3 secretory phospholipase A2-like n=1 Tax=Homalodisca vitripennis TaxID=197043 RepID=UPI001EEBCF42|nr:group 3 secretory phospholipase A2-like [Homalodisca vitripennis]